MSDISRTSAVIVVLALLIAGTLSRSQLVANWIGVVATIAVTGLTVFGLYYTDRLRVQLPTPLLFGIAGLFGIYLGHVLVGNFGSASLAVWPFYTTFVAGTLLFVLPALVPERTVFRIVSRFAVCVGLIGMFVVFVRPFTIPIVAIELTTWHDKSAPFLPAEAAMRSVTANPNEAGILFAVGAVAAIREWLDERTVVAKALAVLAILSLYLSQSRGGFALFLISITLYPVFRYSKPHIGVKLLAFGLAGTVLFVFSRIGVLPSFGPLERVPLTHRDDLWRGAVDALLSENAIRWLFGPGIIDTGEWIAPYVDNEQVSGTPVHGAYFHFLRFGIVGAGIWLLTVWSSILGEALNENQNHFALALSSGFGVLMIFEAVNVFDTRIGAILMALSFGYLFAGVSRTIVIKRPTTGFRPIFESGEKSNDFRSSQYRRSSTEENRL
ncbi:hypothetical protein [Natronococcus pandeyae]|nr:hypothetical protein [Natronococcus pandeyae]